MAATEERSHREVWVLQPAVSYPGSPRSEDLGSMED